VRDTKFSNPTLHGNADTIAYLIVSILLCCSKNLFGHKSYENVVISQVFEECFRFEVLTAVGMKTTVFWNVKLIVL
jgi:hypothetical protein